MKNLLFLLFAIVMASCDELQVESGPGPLVALKKENEVEKPYSNPNLIFGTDFGNFFKTMYTHGKFDDMLKFTSKESIHKFGSDEILNFYKNELKFGYELNHLRSINLSGDTITLNYTANIIATKKVVRIKIVVENDSCKIVLPNKLKDFPN